MKSFLLSLLTLLLVLGFFRTENAQRTIFVDADATGSADGSSWENAYPQLQDALAAAVGGDEIWVAEGTYHSDQGAGQTEDDRTATFRLKHGVILFGGFAGVEQERYARSPQDHATILSGEIGAEGDSTDNAYHVVTGSGTDSTAVLDGFIIMGGNADGTDLDGAGGGMIIDQGNPLIINVRFLGNAARRGGGLFIRDADPTLVNTVFSGNRGTQGGGLYNQRSNPSLRNVTFSANGAEEGAAIYNEESSPVVANSIVWGDPSDAPPAELTFAQRNAALDAVEAEFAALRDGREGDLVALASFISERPEFEAAGVNDDSTVWGRFTDGRLLMVAGNRGLPADTSASGSVQPSLRPPPLDQAQQRARIPTQTKAYVLNALGSCFSPNVEHVATLLEGAGYTVAAQREATVDALKNVNDAGVFLFEAHGAGAGTRDSARTFAFSTYTQVDSTRDAKYEADLESGRLAYMIVTHQQRNGECQEEKLYGITPLFVLKHLSFAENSLAFLSTCSSDNPIMRRSFGNVGATAYAGWTGPVQDDDAGVAASFFFDRALGRNEAHQWFARIEAEDPPQRPFGYGPVLQNMQDKLLDLSDHEGEISRFRVVRPESDDNLLVPTIERMIYWGNKYTVEGNFGSDPGESNRRVTFNGDPVDIQHWSNETVHVDKEDLPEGEAGDVTVEMQGLESNTVPLTAWRDWSIKQTYLPAHAGAQSYGITFDPGPLRAVVNCVVDVRANVHDYRDEPGTAPLEQVEGSIEISPQSECVFVYSGTISKMVDPDPDEPDDEYEVVVKWSGGGPYRADSIVSGSFDMKRERLEMEIGWSPSGTEIVEVYPVDPEQDTSRFITEVIPGHSFANTPQYPCYHHAILYGDYDCPIWSFKINDDYDVQAGSINRQGLLDAVPDTAAFYNWLKGSYEYTAEGTSVGAENAPDPDMRR